MPETLHPRVEAILQELGYEVTDLSCSLSCAFLRPGFPGYCASEGRCVAVGTMKSQAKDGDLDEWGLTRYCQEVCKGAIAAGCSGIVYAHGNAHQSLYPETNGDSEASRSSLPSVATIP